MLAHIAAIFQQNTHLFLFSRLFRGSHFLVFQVLFLCKASNSSIIASPHSRVNGYVIASSKDCGSKSNLLDFVVAFAARA